MKHLILLFVLILSFACSDESGTPVNNSEPGTNNLTTNNTEPTCGERVCSEDEVCRENGGVLDCVCAPGSSRQGGLCVADERCEPTTCGGRGVCTDGDAGPTCNCEDGYAGDFCESCAEGLAPDGLGGCTSDLCSLVDCQDRVCQINGGQAECVCPAGTHDEDGACVPDTTCGPNSCNGHGTCQETEAGIECSCEEGWAAPRCATCDQGFHPDGAGGCTDDPCTPNPCTEANRGQCAADNDMPVCGCNPGYHDESGTCVVDATCEANSCAGHGSCDDSTGVIVCTCEAGYAGAVCDSCDAAAGYHADGAGGCTQDICLPNPCTAAGKTVCVDNGAGGTLCECDAGLHPDGAGGCTNDPCLPNLCAATNQACRVIAGQPECYVPDCDDNNPCTEDTRVNGVCQHSNLPNGSSCSTSACLEAETCSAGVCGGGTARVCDDGNACTDNACDPIAGCVFTNNDANIPDDGVHCTVGSCSNGFASHSPSNTLCDNGLYCDGEEVCQPQAAGADAQGCVTLNVPVKPANPGPCQVYGACDEASQSFPLTTLGAGAACDDGIWCTNNDQCNASGQCVGTAQASCNSVPLTCTSTTTFDGLFNIPDAPLSLTITLKNQPLPATGTDSSSHLIYAVAKDTGVKHLISGFYWSSNQLWRTDSTRLMPGVYDILYRKNETSTDSGYVYRTNNNDIGPGGVRYLMRDIVFTGQPLAVNIPDEPLSLTVTLNGSPLPATGSDSSSHLIYAVAKDTGVRHLISGFYWSSNQLWRTDSTRLMPGNYDILYRKNETSTDSGYVYRTNNNDIGPGGVRYLARDVNFSGGALSVDIPDETLSLTITLNGAALPTTGSDSSSHLIYAVAKDTGVRHLISGFYWSSNQLWRTDSTRLIPGTYDILYRKNETSTDSGYVYRTNNNDIGPGGVRYLARDITFTGGALSVDIPDVSLDLTITLNGAALPATGSDSSSHLIYAVSKDTGVRHLISGFYWSSNQLWRTDSTRLIPGTYDILYRKNETSTDSGYVYRTNNNDIGPGGVRYLARDVNINGAPLAINIPDVPLDLTITLNGLALPATGSDSSSHLIYAVAKDTGVRHLISGFYWSSNQLWRTDSTRLIPGTYDILYRKNETSTDSGYVYRTNNNDIGPGGVRYLLRDVNIGGGPLAINIPQSALTFDVHLNGATLPATGSDSSSHLIYAVSKDTGVRHLLTGFYWSSNQLWRTDSTRLIPGVYDILYRKNETSTDSGYVYRTNNNDIGPGGVRLLNTCVEFL